MSSQDERYAKALIAFGDGDFEVADELLSAVEQTAEPIAAAADLPLFQLKDEPEGERRSSCGLRGIIA